MGQLRARLSADRTIAWLVAATTTVFVLWQLYPSKLVQNTTPVFGDFGGHLEAAKWARDDLLPAGRLSGWSMDWFTGFPVLLLYFPLGSLLVATLGFVLPINVAIKLVAAAGPATLPMAAYAFGRLNQRDRLTSACYAVAVLPLLLEPLLHVSGGAILASVSSGEYGYGLSLSLGLLTLGVARAGLRTGGRRALTAVLLAATILFHVLPAALVVVGMIVSSVMPPTRAKAQWVGTVLVTSFALAAFWLVPFARHLELTAGPHYERSAPLLLWMVPPGMAPVAVVAGLAVVFHILAAAAGETKPDPLGTFLVVMTVLTGLAFALTPDGQVWNARFLPLFFLSLCLLAGNGLARWAGLLDDRRRQRARARKAEFSLPMLLLLPPVLFAAILPVWASRLGDGLLLEEQGPATRFPSRTLGGYEGFPDTRAHVESVAATMREVGRRHGCGRSHWERTTDDWGYSWYPVTYFVPSLTDGCISLLEGLYVQSSPTSTYVDVANQRLSMEPGRVSTRSWSVDVEAGVADLRRLGARYFVAADERTKRMAARSPDLRRLADTRTQDGGSWRVFEVVDGGQTVEPLAYAPVVVRGAGASRGSWERTLTTWAQEPASSDVLVAAAGPESWPRRDDLLGDLPRRPVPQTTVEDVELADDRVSFRVSRTGTPVLVKVSYFPNWDVEGADGPWRVTPNQMVVVPTEREVTLRYGRTGAELFGAAVTVAGLAGVGWLATRPPVAMPEPPVEEPVAERPKRRPGATKKKPKKRRR